MELRWILILAGVGIFAFLYFSGRPNKSRTPFDNVLGNGFGNKGRHPQSADAHPSHPNPNHGGRSYEPSHDNPGSDGYAGGTYPNADPHYAPSSQMPPANYADHPGIQHDHHSAPTLPADNVYADNVAGGHPTATSPATSHYSDVDPLMQDPHAQPHSSQHPSMGIDPGDMQRPADPTQAYGHGADGYADQQGYSGGQAGGQDYADPAMGYDIAPGVDASRSQQGGGLSNFLAQLSGGLLGRARGGAGKKGDADTLYSSNGVEPFLITLHVVAPDGQIIHGPRLQSLFEQRGYHFGEMNIFHSLNQGNIVFSIAKMVEPGTFDLNDPASFETPGISMILQLPAPVVADVAFEVLISEAEELASVLGCSILDGDFSTLSQQTVQHLRDNVHQFMHRQRLAETVPS